jgi:hypothetical protein
MLQVGENQVGFLIKNKRYGWFTPINTAVEHEDGVGQFKAIGARDVGLCSMVTIANNEGAIVAHMSPATCALITKDVPLNQPFYDQIMREFNPLKEDSKLFLQQFKRNNPGRYTVILARGPQSNAKQYGEWMAQTLFGIPAGDIQRVINLQGNQTPGNSIATFFVDFTAARARIFHGPTDGRLTEEPL